MMIDSNAENLNQIFGEWKSHTFTSSGQFSDLSGRDSTKDVNYNLDSTLTRTLSTWLHETTIPELLDWLVENTERNSSSLSGFAIASHVFQTDGTDISDVSLAIRVIGERWCHLVVTELMDL